MKKLLFSAAIFGALSFSPSAHAHFLWAQTDAENSELALYFGEGGDGVITDVAPELLAKAAAWTPSGQKLAPRLRAGAYRAPIDAQNHVWGAHQSWGVLDRTQSGRGVFRLEYYAKAATFLEKAGLGAKLPVELFARRDGNDALVTFKRDGKTVSGASVTVVSPLDAKGATLSTDEKGQIRFPATVPGLYALRAVATDLRSGELDGKKYPQTRHWTSLCFRVAAPRNAALVAANAPANSPATGNPNADPRAYALLKEANGNRQVMPADFVGFEAELFYKDGETVKTGKVVYRRQGETQIALDGLSAPDKAWLDDKILNIVGHRRGGDFAQGDGRHPLSLVEGDVNEFGQLIRLNDRMQSEYRVKDGRVTEVTRVAGGVRFTISVLDALETQGGKYLANHFTVCYRDEKTGALQKVEGYRDTYAQIDGVWLPTSRVVYDMAQPITPRVRFFRLRNIKTLPPAAQLAAR